MVQKLVKKGQLPYGRSRGKHGLHHWHYHAKSIWKPILPTYWLALQSADYFGVDAVLASVLLFFEAHSVRCRIISISSSFVKLAHFKTSLFCLSLASLTCFAASRSCFLTAFRRSCKVEISFFIFDDVVANGAMIAKCSAFSCFLSSLVFFFYTPDLF